MAKSDNHTLSIGAVAQLTGIPADTIRTWERGAGLTLACGLAACAAAVCAARLGKTGRKVRINPPGGSLARQDEVHFHGARVEP